jgi:hypothetical protein
LQHWFESQQQTKTDVAPCPVCKTLLRKEADIYPVEKGGKGISGFVWRMIQGLRIKSNAQGVEEQESDSNQVHEVSCGFEEVEKQSPPSPREVSTNCSLDDCSTEGKSEGDDCSSPDASWYQDSAGHDLFSLIKDLIEITEEIQLPPSKHENATPGLSAVAMSDVSPQPGLSTIAMPDLEAPPGLSTVAKPDLAPPPGLSTVAMPDLAPPPGLSAVATPDLAPPPGLSAVATPDLAPEKVTRSIKTANKKQQRTKDISTSSAKSKCVTPEEVRAYHQQIHNDMAKYQIACVQQMAKYQIAYAQQYQMAYAQQCQQYHMAMHAFQMQRYSKQVPVAAGGSK